MAGFTASISAFSNPNPSTRFYITAFVTDVNLLQQSAASLSDAP